MARNSGYNFWDLFDCKVRERNFLGRILSVIRNHKWFVVLFIGYLSLSLFFLINNPGNIFNEPDRFGEEISTYGSRDAALYVKMAWQIINENIYGYNGEVSNAYVTPGQPFYIVALIKIAQLFDTNHIMVIRLSNMLLNMGILTLIYLISMRLFNKKSIGIIAGLIYATHATPMHMFRTTLTEIPTIFLLMLSIYIFIVALKKDTFMFYTLFGIVAAITLMFRATPAPLLLLAWGIVIYQYGFKKAVKIGFIWCIGPLLVFTPWVARNLSLFGEMYLFSSHAGGPLLAGTNFFQLDDYGNLLNEAINRGLTEEELAKERIKEEFFNDMPLFIAWFTVGKLIWLFISPEGFPDGVGTLRGYVPMVFIIFYLLQNVITAFGALLFAFLVRKRKVVNLLSLFVLIYICFSNIFLTLPRYGFLIYPILAILFAYSVVMYTNRIRRFIAKRQSGTNKALEE